MVFDRLIWGDVYSLQPRPFAPTQPPGLAMRCLTLAVWCALVFAPWMLAPQNLFAQKVSKLTPSSCQPGTSTQLRIEGTDLTPALRVIGSSSVMDAHLESTESNHALLRVTIPANAPPGPYGLLLADHNGPLSPLDLLIDELPVVADSGQNHTRQTAQPIELLASIEGACDAAASDWYKMQIAQPQRVAFEILTQQLRSKMDPVLRLVDSTGDSLLLADEGPTGPDCRFSYNFPAAGEYWIEVFDSRHAAAGERYQLRVGDFPIVDTVFPMGVQRQQAVTLGFAGADEGQVEPCQFSCAEDATDTVFVATRLRDGKSSTWLPVAACPYPQWSESEDLPPLSPPLGISGRLAEQNEIDILKLLGSKGQSLRFASRTRDLGSPTLLQMQLWDAAGSKLVETQVSAADAWSFDFTFPEDGEYQLRVSDLLGRGGPAFTYWIQIIPAATFSVALKADAATKEQFTLEPGHGAAAIDLTISRFAFEGEIDISLEKPVPGLSILNPRVPTGAAEARIYLTVDDQWKADQFVALRLVATAVADPAQRSLVSSRAAHRVKTPFVINPPVWDDGLLQGAGASASETPFTLEPARPVQFARPVTVHPAVFVLKRVNEAFKDPATLLGDLLPDGWGLKATADKDNYTLTLTRASGDLAQVESLPLAAYAEFNGRGRVQRFPLAVEWIDPVQVQLEFPEPLVRGGTARVRANVRRLGSDPQPVLLSLASPPAGLVGPESITVAADQSQVEFDLQIGPQVPDDSSLSLSVSSKAGGQDFSINSSAEKLPIVDQPSQISVYPSEIRLQDPRSRQQVVVTGHSDNQQVRDWTRFAHINSANPEIVVVERGIVKPVAEGTTEIMVQVGGLTQKIPVQVAGMSQPRPIAFESEVLVALSKQGCNSGACHGSPSGKGGFRLSLRAFDMQLDEMTLIREDFGRRVNVIQPDQSLLLQKPLMRIAHGGGRQLRPGDMAYSVLVDWIAAGARADPAGVPRVERLEVYPSQKQVLNLADGGQQFAVTAHFTDGSQRDVTEMVAYETSDTSVATVDEHGLVSPHARGSCHSGSLPRTYRVRATDVHRPGARF